MSFSTKTLSKPLWTSRNVTHPLSQASHTSKMIESWTCTFLDRSVDANCEVVRNGWTAACDVRWLIKDKWTDLMSHQICGPDTFRFVEVPYVINLDNISSTEPPVTTIYLVKSTAATEKKPTPLRWNYLARFRLVANMHDMQEDFKLHTLVWICLIPLHLQRQVKPGVRGTRRSQVSSISANRGEHSRIDVDINHKGN